MKRFIISLFIGFISIFNSFSQSRGIEYKNALKVEILSPLSNHLGINYEHKVSPTVIWEVKGGIAGIGLDWDPAYEEDYSMDDFFYEENGNAVPARYESSYSKTKEWGFFLRFGPKLMLKPSEDFSGAYFYPSAFFSHSSYGGENKNLIRKEDGTIPIDNYPTHYSYDFRANSAGLLFNLGYQAQMFERLVLDINFGMGYAHNMDKYDKQNLLETSFQDPYGYDYNPGSEKFFRYSHIGLGPYDSNGRVALNMGVALGYTF